jgi:putative spermidine/putrescine transport system permease protein
MTPASVIRMAARHRRSASLLGLLPLAAYLGFFLFVPGLNVILGSFRGSGGNFTASAVTQLLQQPYRTGFVRSVELSAASAVSGGLIGLFLAGWLSGPRRPGWVRRPVMALSAVLTYIGGIPLAFMFIATLGTTGFATRLLAHLGVPLYADGFSLYTLSGLVIVYTYFQVPLMVIIMLPAFEGLRPQWQDAATSLGASQGKYWRWVAWPVLAPSCTGGLILLFANAFSGYATAYALTAGSLPLVPLQIGSLLDGSLSGQTDLGDALGLGMIIVMAAALFVYYGLQRRVSRWLR